MSTYNQLVKKGRPSKPKKVKAKALRNSYNSIKNTSRPTTNPQKKGVVTVVKTMTPKKPHSALRKVAKVKLSNRTSVTAYIPGIGHNITEHAIVAVRGGRGRDTGYPIPFGEEDGTTPQESPIKLSRSRYGVKNWHQPQNMSRKNKPGTRLITPDYLYNSQLVIN